jgi:hypothetical protein
VKNHDFTPKNHIFSNFRGAGSGGAPLDLPLLDHFAKVPKHTYTRPEEADVTSLLNSICNFDLVVKTLVVELFNICSAV